MFCNNCGKIIVEKSAFCTWCGSRLSIPAEQPVPQPEAAQEQLDPVQAGADTIYLDKQEQTADIPEDQEQTVEQSFSQPEPEENTVAVPPQGNEESFEKEHGSSIPLGQTDYDGSISVNMSEQPQSSRKYYTGGQLALCLVITGIMAAAAGVFAGLYFSVIL